MKPVCVSCRRFYRPKKNGYYFTEMMPRPGVSKAEPGTARPEDWTPYKLWVGDLWRCEGCGAEIVVGVGRMPIAEHYQSEFSQISHAVNAAQLKVNDC